MEKLSRVQKYSNLRNNLIFDNKDKEEGTNFESEKLKELSQKLVNIDPIYFNNYKDKNDDVVNAKMNDLLDNVINDVKNYNISRGNRNSADTQLDILKGLKDDISITSELFSNNEINTDKDNTDEINQLFDTQENININEENTESNLEDELKKKLLEDTQHIKLKIDDYESDLDVIDRKISKTNFVLSLLITILGLIIVALSIYFIFLLGKGA